MDVKFVSGKKAIMTVYKDGVTVEEIHLHEYEEYEDTSEKLHALFAEKGFVRLTEEETKQRIANMEQEEEENRIRRIQELEEMKRKRREERGTKAKKESDEL